MGSTIFICAMPPTNPSRGFRFEVSPLTSTIRSWSAAGRKINPVN